MKRRQAISAIGSRLRGKKTQEQRFTIDELAQMYRGTNQLMHLGRGSAGGPNETIENDFVGYVNGVYKASGVVFACCLTRMLIFSEAKFMWQRMEKGRPTKLFGTPALGLLEKPWPNGTTGELLSRAIQDADLSGNFYAVEEDEDASGKPIEKRLRRLRPDWVEIILSKEPSLAVHSDVVGYLYKPGNTNDKRLWKLYPIDGSEGRVVHWSPLPDPDAQYRGMSPLTPVIREIQGDKAATTHKLKFFENAATPNLAVSFKETVTAEQFKEFMATMDEAKSGIDHAYETLYLGGGADVTVVGANIQQMDFKQTQGMSETRIAAALRVHPALVGLSEGLKGSSLNEGNFKAARDGFANGTLRPLWRSFCAALEPVLDVPEGARLWFDTRDIAYLRQDQREIAEIQRAQSATISSLVMQGFTPDSVVASVEQEDLTLLEHTGLYSVQLQPPMPDGSNVDQNDDSKPDLKKIDPNAGKKTEPAKPADDKRPATEKKKPDDGKTDPKKG